MSTVPAILYVEDNGIERRHFEGKFARHPLAQHFRLLTDSGLNWLEILNARDFVVVVSDFKLPGSTGLKVLWYYKERNPQGIGVLVSSDYSPERDGSLPEDTVFFPKDLRHCEKVFEYLAARLMPK